MTQDELNFPDKSWDQIMQEKKDHDYRGNYFCKLCPNRILQSEADLRDHLSSKKHIEEETKFYRKNRVQIHERTMAMYSMFAPHVKGTAKWRKLKRIGLWYKMKDRASVQILK